MKKILFCLVATLLLTSCSRRASKFEYEGHNYIQFNTWIKYNSGIVHDPRCWCFKDSTHYDSNRLY